MPEPVRKLQSAGGETVVPRRGRGAPAPGPPGPGRSSRPTPDHLTAQPARPASQPAIPVAQPAIPAAQPAISAVTQQPQPPHPAASSHHHQPVRRIMSGHQEATQHQRVTTGPHQEGRRGAASPPEPRRGVVTPPEPRRGAASPPESCRPAASLQDGRRAPASFRDAHHAAAGHHGPQRTGSGQVTFSDQVAAQRASSDHVAPRSSDHQLPQRTRSLHHATPHSSPGSPAGSFAQPWNSYTSHLEPAQSGSGHRGQSGGRSHPTSPTAGPAQPHRSTTSAAGHGQSTAGHGQTSAERRPTAGQSQTQPAVSGQTKTPAAAAENGKDRSGGRLGAHTAAGAGQRPGVATGFAPMTAPVTASRTGQGTAVSRTGAGISRVEPVRVTFEAPTLYTPAANEAGTGVCELDGVLQRQTEPSLADFPISAAATATGAVTTGAVTTAAATAVAAAVATAVTATAPGAATAAAGAATAAAGATAMDDGDGDIHNSMGFQITSITASRTDAAAADADADADESADGGDESGDEDGAAATETAAVGRALLTSPAEAVTGPGVLPAIPTVDGFGIRLVPSSVPAAAGGAVGALVQLPTPSEMDLITGSPPSPAAGGSDWQSRFKVVRIETNVPFKCGRWQCMDYHDQPKRDGDQDGVPALIPAQQALETAEWPLGPPAVAAPRRASYPTPPPPPPEVLEGQTAAQQGRTMPHVLPGGSSLLDLVRSAVGDNATQESSASPGGSSLDNKIEPIDNKIEQAMDLVKSHLLLAVREEVDVLKANISKLVDKISVLERENEVLKTNASPEVLAKLADRPQAPTAAGQLTAGHRVA